MKKNQETGLSVWQLSMMAVGSVIGGSFFLGSSVAIHSAGPSIILSYILGGILVYYILFALSEMTVNDPDAGSFQTFTERAYGKMAGFVTGWVYWAGIVLAMSSEATAISVLVKIWFPHVSTLILGSIIIVSVTVINLLGAQRLGKLESILAAVKLITVAAFIVMGALLIIGVIKGNQVGGNHGYSRPAFLMEPFFANGFKGFSGSLLVVIYAYSGFEVLGLAAAEAKDPRKTVPVAIHKVVTILLTLYIISVGIILALIPTDEISGDRSPMVAALEHYGFDWAGNILNIILITAILSTMLASMFGVGRMIRTLASEGLAPAFLKEKAEVPYRGLIFSGCAMLLALLAAILMPQVYVFLISAGGFSSIFVYIMIMASHIRFRERNGKPNDKLRLEGFPYSSLFVMICLIAAVAFMPFVKGQTAGLAAGFMIIAFFSVAYLFVKKHAEKPDQPVDKS